jgi:hypothetical protein
MKEIKLIVEGPSDKKFIGDLISFMELKLDTIKVSFIELNGKDDSCFAKSLAQFLTNEEDGKNVIVIDANDDDISLRKKHISDLLARDNINAEIFFLPNNEHKGYLETLLIGTILEKNQAYFDCFQKFEECVSSNATNNPPSIKDKAYIYTCSLLSKEENKQRDPIVNPKKINYRENRFYDLTHSTLDPLKLFLTSNIN